VISPAAAHPDGAPWDRYGRPGGPDCTECHFDAPPQRQSETLILSGLPAAAEAGAKYDLLLTLRNGEGIAGFLIASESGGGPAGVFEAPDEGLEAEGAALRSTRPRAFAGEQGSVSWGFRWSAPADMSDTVEFYVAANAGNDDASPFGDRIFLSVFRARAAK
jgi:hypothetical protein